VAFTFVVSAFDIQWTLLILRFFHMLYGDGTTSHFEKINLNELDLTKGQFGAAAAMISFGALIGKVSSDQMFWLSFLEMIFYSLNIYIGDINLKAMDMGGTIFFIHTFGAYFGLAATMVLSPPVKGNNYTNNSSIYHADIFSFIGTTFLWIFWQSFNAAEGQPEEQMIITINTRLAICASCLVGFSLSRTIRGTNTYMVLDLQNATLAGGVAIGASCNVCIEPAGAILVGVVAGAVSVLGFAKLMPFLEHKIGLQDTCGVHNLHGLPGLVGSLAMVIATAANALPAGFPKGTVVYPHGDSQWGYQIAATIITLIIALSSGALSAWLVKKTIPGIPRVSDRLVYFSDEAEFHIPPVEVDIKAS